MHLQIKLLVVILFISLHSFSQKKTDSIEYVYKYPVKEGYIYYKEDKAALYTPVKFANIYSRENDVYSLSQGKVVGIYRIEDEDCVLIRNGDTTFQYCNIDSAIVQRGSTVRRGDFIGKLQKDTDDGRYELTFGVAIGTKGLGYRDYAKFLKQYNK